MWFRHFVWKCFPVLPLVYDDTLSFYELLSKMAKKINEVISGLLEMKVVVDRNSDAVLSVNNTKPDDNGNVNLSQVSGVTSVCGVGADGEGNVAIDADDVGAIPKSATTFTDSAMYINSEFPHGYCYLTVNGILGVIKGAFDFPSTDFTVINNIFGQANVFGVLCAYIDGNPLNLPTMSYASPGVPANNIFGHGFTTDRPIGEVPSFVGELDFIVMYNGTRTEVIATGGYVDNYKSLLAGQAFIINGVVLKQVT